MSVRPATLVAVLAASFLLGGGGVMAGATGMFAGDASIGGLTNLACGQSAPAGTGDDVNDNAKVDGFSAEQVANATTIVRVGQQMQVPPRGWVVAVATARQESRLINLGNLGKRNDHDSLGLFQQRPSQGWGTPEQVQNPEYASRAFYTHLLAINGWEKLPLTVAAQRVQRSKYPDAYADDEPAAAQLVNAISTGGPAQSAATPGACAQPGEVTAGGWTVPVRAKVVSGFRTPERPTHQGVDLGVPKGTQIHAAAAGTVIVVMCQATLNGRDYGCDHDGGMSIKGCGWYVDISHADGVITRYCHMVEKPKVSAGDVVAAGQVIGLSGSSGNSSGPHLHFEVHTGGDGHASGAIDPVPWMREHGVPLGASP